MPTLTKPFIVATAMLGTLVIATMAQAGIRYVNAARPDDSGNGLSWATAKKTLQAALVSPNGGDDVWVAAGVYKPDQGGGQSPGNRNATFQLASGMGIYGGFAGGETSLAQRDIEANPTILSGDLSGNDTPVSCTSDSQCAGFGDHCLGGTCNLSGGRGDNSFHVVTGTSATSAILDGFTITGGNANGSSPDNRGGGMTTNGGTPIVTNCVFTRNFATFGGGGMYDSSNGTTVTDCTFLRNTCGSGGGGGGSGGGGLVTQSSNITIAKCTFRENVSQGFGGGSNGLGGGLHISGGSGSAMVFNCAFFGNRAASGGGMAITGSGSGGPKINLAFSGNSAENGGALYMESSNIPLTNCTFSKNVASNHGGGIHTSSGPTIRNSILWENMDDGGMDESAQIHNASGGSAVVNYSIVQGGWTGASGPGNLSNNPQFIDANGPDNIYGTPDDNLALSPGSAAIDSGQSGHLSSDTADLDGDGDTFELMPIDLAGDPRQVDDPSVSDTGVGPLPVVDMGAYERQVVPITLYVDAAAAGANNGSSWTDAFLHLQDALSLAASDASVTEIWVADGTYMPDGGRTPTGGAHVNGSGDRNATFQLLDNVAVYGGFASGETMLSQRDIVANLTALSGDLAGDDAPVFCTLNSDCGAFKRCLDGTCLESGNNGENAFHIVTGSGTDNTAILDGFTITAANANGILHHGQGGGLYANSGSPTVSNCTLSANASNNSGAGMYFVSSSGARVTNCTFSRNSTVIGGGGLSNNSGSAALTNCTFLGNWANGTGGGSGGGANYANSGNGTIINCTFLDNEAGVAGAMLISNSSNPAVTNCAFSGNSAARGGAMQIAVNSSPVLTNCTFSGNVAQTQDGGGIYSNNSETNPLLVNCILWGNSDTGGMDESAQLHAANGSVPSVYYSIVQGGWTGAGGTGNSAGDPLFVDADGLDNDAGTIDDDLRLSPASPASDSGDNSAVPQDTADLDGDGDVIEQTPLDLAGNLRRVDDPFAPDTGVGSLPIVDMGAYEVVTSDAVVYVDASATGAGNGASWPHAFVHLQTALAFALANPEIIEIWVADGTYMPDGGRTPVGGAHVNGSGNRGAAFQLINGVRIYGGFAGGETMLSQRDPAAHETILSGDLLDDDALVPCTQDSPDCDGLGPGFGILCLDGFCIIPDNIAENSHNVIKATDINPTAVIDGFTITAGNANGPIPANTGGGMYNNDGNALVTGCTFRGNSASSGGGMFNTGSGPTITDCTFSKNAGVSGGAMLNTLSSAPIVTNCTFDGNSSNSQGGGIANFNSSPAVVTSCTFTRNVADNNGGGITNASGSNAIVTRSSLVGNSAAFGGAMFNQAGSDPQVRNCLFNGNTASFGGAMANFDSTTTPAVINCTFHSNSASSAGGGMYNFSGASASIMNSILWGNSDAGGMDESAQIGTDGSTPAVNYCTVQGGWTGGGTGNSADDPLFVDADGFDDILGTTDDNLRLSAASPAIDTGTMLTVLPGTLDLDGQPRAMDGDGDGTAIADMGAYEFSLDCNLNGIPDGQDIANGTLADANMNGLPDACASFTGQCEPPLNTRWSCPENWNLDIDGYPDDVTSVAGIHVSLLGGTTTTLDVDATIPSLHILADATLEVVEPGSAGDLTVNTETGVRIEGSLLAGQNHFIDASGIVTVAAGGLYAPGTSPSNASLTTPSLWIDGPPVASSIGTMILRDSMSVYLTADTEHRSYGDILVGEDSLIEVSSGTFFIDGDGIYKAAASGSRGTLYVGTAECCGMTCECRLSANGPPHTPTFELSGQMAIEVNGDFDNQGVVRMADDATIELAGRYRMLPGSVYEKHPSSMDPATASLVAADILIEPGDQAPIMLSGPRLELTDSMSVHSTGPLHLQGGTLKPGVNFPPSLILSGESSVFVDGTFTMTSVAESINSSTSGVFVGGDFDNRLFSSNLFDWTMGHLTMNGIAPQAFEVAASDGGVTDSALDMPFAIGTLRIAVDADVTFIDTFNNNLSDQSPCTEALYVGTLMIEAGAAVTLDNCRIYYDALQQDPAAIVEFVGCGELVNLNPAPAAPTAEPAGVSKGRVAAVVVPPPAANRGPGELTALRITLTTLNHPRLCCLGEDGDGFGMGCNVNTPCDSDAHCSGGTPLCRHSLAPGTPNFSAFEGKIRYVNSFPGGSLICPDDGPPFNTTYRCATLGCEPEYRDWATDLNAAVNPPAVSGLLHISGDAMIPSSTIHVEHMAASCGVTPGANTCTAASAPLAVTTARWGDLNGAGFSPPDGKSDVLDIPPIVNKLKTVSPIFPEPRLWLKQRDPVPNTDAITVIDLSDVVDAGPQAKPYSASRTIDSCAHD